MAPSGSVACTGLRRAGPLNATPRAGDQLKPALTLCPVPAVAVAPHRLLETLGDGLLHTPVCVVPAGGQCDLVLEELHDEIGVLRSESFISKSDDQA